MKKSLLLTVCLILISCTNNNTHKDSMYVINTEREIKIEKFILQGIKETNNVSNNEMKKVIIELRRTAYNLYCPSVAVMADISGNVVTSEYELKEDEHFVKQIYNTN